MQYRYVIATFIILAIISLGVWSPQPQVVVQAQPRITNTTRPVVIPSTAPTEPPQASNNAVVEASPSPTFTPTQPLPNAIIRSIAPAGTAIIRDFPEDGASIGVLQNDTDYQVLGQFISWYQIQLSTAPNGVGWVYFEDITISGDLSSIPAIDPSAQTVQSPEEIATGTAIAQLQTPSVAQTATAESRILEIPPDATSVSASGDTRLPTYTPPADINPTNEPNVLPTSISNDDLVESTLSSIASGNIPPIVPILGLAIFGFIGLLISSIRGQ